VVVVASAVGVAAGAVVVVLVDVDVDELVYDSVETPGSSSEATKNAITPASRTTTPAPTTPKRIARRCGSSTTGAS
jgi:hypothetical protein